MDVLAGGEVHDGVRAPLGGPAHFLDFLLDARGDGAVADVGVDLHQEVAADDHRLGFRVIDVGRDDGAPAATSSRTNSGVISCGNALGKTAEDDGMYSDRWTHDRGQRFWLQLDAASVLLNEIVADEVARHLRDLRPSHVLADGDELHLRRDDALARVPELRDGVPGRRPEGPAPCVPRRLERGEAAAAFGGELGVAGAQVAVVLGPYVAAVVFLDIAPLENPFPTQGGQSLFDVTAECRVAPRSACVVDPHGLVHFDGAVERLRG